MHGTQSNWPFLVDVKALESWCVCGWGMRNCVSPKASRKFTSLTWHVTFIGYRVWIEDFLRITPDNTSWPCYSSSSLSQWSNGGVTPNRPMHTQFCVSSKNVERVIPIYIHEYYIKGNNSSALYLPIKINLFFIYIFCYVSYFWNNSLKIMQQAIKWARQYGHKKT